MNGVTGVRADGLADISYRVRRVAALTVAASVVLAAAGCSTAGNLPSMHLSPIGKTTQHGYVLPPGGLDLVPVGSSRDQVLVALGTPSTTAQFGGEVFYYISQTRKKSVAFMNAQVVDQRIVAIYFDKNGKVARVANYGLQDGKLFDFVSRTTPTGGQDQGFLTQVFSGGPSLSNILGGGG